MTQKERYEKSLKENARRHYKQEYEHLVLRTAIFVHRTYDILKGFGLSEKEIQDLYLKKVEY